MSLIICNGQSLFFNKGLNLKTILFQCYQINSQKLLSFPLTKLSLALAKKTKLDDVDATNNFPQVFLIL
jgi:hypothetical protein